MQNCDIHRLLLLVISSIDMFFIYRMSLCYIKWFDSNFIIMCSIFIEEAIAIKECVTIIDRQTPLF